MVLLQFCSKETLPPTARFSFSPYKGNTASIFIFDARHSGDDDDNIEKLQARWDWDNDGEWDTQLSSELVQEHRFDASGVYYVTLQIIDSDGLSSELTREILVTEIGPLYIPVVVYPEDNCKNVKTSVMLNWSCYHVDKAEIRYDIYFGDNPNPHLIKRDFSSTLFSPGRLESGTNYYWKIVAKDDYGNKTTGHVSTFFTHLFDERDGQEYDLIKTEELFWMAENLNYQTDSGWWCHSDDLENCEKYGKLYNWETAMISCPPGWYLPSDLEWQSFEVSLFMFNPNDWGARGNNQGDKIRVGGSSGFNAIMAGTRDFWGDYSILGTDAGFWTSTGNNYFAFYRYIFFEQPYIFRYNLPGVHGLSVRCVKTANE